MNTAPNIYENFIETIKANNDIVSVASAYGKLTSAGQGYVCNCPSCANNEQSCNISPDSQTFICYDCGEGGDVIDFIQKAEKVEFAKGVKMLADRAGVEIPEDIPLVVKSDERLFQITREAARYFYDNLRSPVGVRGQNYCKGRGLGGETARTYAIGYATDDWHNLQSYLHSKGFTNEEMVAASLVGKSDKGNYYDLYRDRVMFPIFNKEGNIISFGGRAIEADEKAKYLNGKETDIFKKGENLFSLNVAKNTKEDFFILCEGYMDVVSLYQAGFDNGVASLGTALTAEQSSLIKRYTDNVIISYDADEAGQKATQRAIEIFEKVGIQAKILHIPEAKDPDEFIKKHGADRFRTLLETAETANEYKFNKLKAEYADKDMGEFLKASVDFISEIKEKTERTAFIAEVAAMTKQEPSLIGKYIVDKDKETKPRNAKNGFEY